MGGAMVGADGVIGSSKIKNKVDSPKQVPETIL